MINIILAEDHSLVRYGIKLLLETSKNISIIGEAISGLEVLDQLKRGNKPDIILTDLNMPEMSGMQLLKEVKENYPAISVVILTMIDEQNTIVEAFDHSAQGYLLKDISANELVYALTHVYNGGKYISSDLSHVFFKKSLQVFDSPVTSPSTLTFSSREMEVLSLIADGLTNSEMSEKLFLSKRTIEGHRQSLIDKTKCKNTASLIKYAVIHGIIH